MACTIKFLVAECIKMSLWCPPLSEAIPSHVLEECLPVFPVFDIRNIEHEGRSDTYWELSAPPDHENDSSPSLNAVPLADEGALICDPNIASSTANVSSMGTSPDVDDSFLEPRISAGVSVRSSLADTNITLPPYPM
jgi:hypothetical protein